jgi:hypothetical protein
MCCNFSKLLAGGVKESRNDNPTGDLLLLFLLSEGVESSTSITELASANYIDGCSIEWLREDIPARK